MSIIARQAIENFLLKEIITALSIHADKNNKGQFVIECSEENEKFDNVEKAIAYCMDLDEALLAFRIGGNYRMVYLVFGNDGYDLISDYSVALDEFEWFKRINDMAMLIELGQFRIVIGKE